MHILMTQRPWVYTTSVEFAHFGSQDFKIKFEGAKFVVWLHNQAAELAAVLLHWEQEGLEGKQYYEQQQQHQQHSEVS